MADKKAPFTVGQMVAQAVAGPDTLAEAYRRNLLPPARARAFEESARRGVIHVDGPTQALIDARQRSVQRFDDGGLTGHYASGSTYGLIDELGGALNAIGVGMDKKIGPFIRSLATADSGAAQTFHAKPPSYSMADAYRAGTQASREGLRATAAAHPVATTVASLAGSLKAPGVVAGGKYVAAAPNLLGQIGRGALVGGAIGSASGAGNTNGGVIPRLKGAAKGGAIGAAIGGATPAVIAGGRRVVVPLAKGAINMTADAGRQIGRVLSQSELQLDAAPTPGEANQAARRIAELARATGLTPQQVLASTQPTTAQAMGRSAVNSAASLARRVGTTPDKMEALMAEQAAAEPASILDKFAEITGIHPSAAKGDIQGIVDAGRERAAPMYEAALSTQDPVWTPRLQELSQKHEMRAAITSAMKDAANSPDLPMEAFLTPLPKGDPSALADEAGGAFRPTARGWDLIKKHIDASLSRDDFGRVRPDTAAPGNYNIRRLGETLSGELRSAIPGYGDALDTASDYLKVQRAFDNGYKLMANTKIGGDEFAQKLADHAPGAEQEAFAGGAARNLHELALRGRLNANAMQTQGMKGKLAALMGDQTDDWAAQMADLSKSAGTRRILAPGAGSPTMPLLNAAGEQDGNAVGDLLSTIAHAPGRPVSAVAKLMQMGSSYGKTAGTTPAVRNAMGDFFMQPPAQGGVQLQEILDRFAPKKAPDQATATISNLLASLAAKSQ